MSQAAADFRQNFFFHHHIGGDDDNIEAPNHLAECLSTSYKRHNDSASLASIAAVVTTRRSKEVERHVTPASAQFNTHTLRQARHIAIQQPPQLHEHNEVHGWSLLPTSRSSLPNSAMQVGQEARTPHLRPQFFLHLRLDTPSQRPTEDASSKITTESCGLVSAC